MDYEFYQIGSGNIMAKFSMDHEAIGYWLNEEIDGDLSLIEKIKSEYQSLKGSEQQWQWVGHEYTLLMDDKEIMIRANQSMFDTVSLMEPLEEGMSYYDHESISFCSIDDFIIILNDYKMFILKDQHAIG